MNHALIQLIPREVTEIVLVLFLSFLIGLEREEQKLSSGQYRFGGVRTFPLLGLLGYALCLFAGENLVPPAVGFAVVGAFLWLSFRHKLEGVALAGMTTELSGLVTYTVGVLVAHGQYWVATTLTVLMVGLLELKAALEGLAKRVPADEILTFAKFLLLTAVILPIVPNQSFGTYGFNPFKTWLVVVAVSAISYLSYLLQIWAKGRGGVVLSALLGGAYSSTLTTIVLAKRAREAKAPPHLFAGAILMASGVMYLRLAILIGIFNTQLLRSVAAPLLALAGAGLAVGWFWSRIPDVPSQQPAGDYVPRNPLELWAAFLFGGIFIVMLVLTRLAVVHLGRGGVFGLAALMGLSDVDPFVLSLTQSAGMIASIGVASSAIVIAAASNSVAKGFYALGFAGRKTGAQTLWLLLGFSVVGCLPLIWLL